MPKLLEQVRNCLRVRHYSYQTEKSDVHWTERFTLFHGLRHPAAVGAPRGGSDSA
jgi:hypothetical protein